MFYLPPLPDDAIINGPGHVEDSEKLEAFLVALAELDKIVIDPVTPPEPGTNGHLAWHNAIVKNTKTLAAALGVPVTLPPLIKAGDVAHVAHHNLIRQALLDVSNKPKPPVVAYTGDGQFTITNYIPSLYYKVTGAARTDNLIKSVSNGATVTVALNETAQPSAASLMNVLPNTRILDQNESKTDTGCGPRQNICCPDGRIQNRDGATCGGAPGSLAPAAFCDGACDDNCWQLTVDCWTWHWSNYTADGYTLIGNTWGKAVNAK